jgi:hypothetical protein
MNVLPRKKKLKRIKRENPNNLTAEGRTKIIMSHQLKVKIEYHNSHDRTEFFIDSVKVREGENDDEDLDKDEEICIIAGAISTMAKEFIEKHEAEDEKEKGGPEYCGGKCPAYIYAKKIVEGINKARTEAEKCMSE